MHSTISAKVTPNDTVFLNYLNDKVKYGSVTTKKETRFGLGYIHAMSKRTEVFANVGRIRESVSDTKSTSWDIGLRHSF
jgi:predicted porin